MAPKAMSQAQKIEKLLTFFHESRTCHTLKDLESSVPSTTKINKMQIKDLLKELTDTNQVKVEKIGSGNWYWAWAGEELGEKLNMVEQLQAEERVLHESISKLTSQLSKQQSQRTSAKEHPGYDAVANKVSLLESEVQTLLTECHEWEVAAADGIDGKRSAMVEHRTQTALHTDNILSLEAYIRRQLPVSDEEMESVRIECYGKLYQEGQDISQFDD